MPITTQCPNCGARMKANESLEGKQATCLHCRTPFIVSARPAVTEAANVVLQSEPPVEPVQLVQPVEVENGSEPSMDFTSGETVRVVKRGPKKRRPAVVSKKEQLPLRDRAMQVGVIFLVVTFGYGIIMSFFLKDEKDRKSVV